MAADRYPWWEDSQNAAFLVVAIVIASMVAGWVECERSFPPLDVQLQAPAEPCPARS